MGVRHTVRVASPLPYPRSTCRFQARKVRSRALVPLRFFASKVYTNATDRAPVDAQAKLSQSDDAAHVSTGKCESILSVLDQRGFVNQVVGARDDLNRLVSEKKAGVYVGVDPTAPSLHVGHLVPLMALYWMYSYGFPVYAVLGGATARIGDPSGRTKARTALSHAEQTTNAHQIHHQLEKLWVGVETELRRNGLSQESSIRRRELVNNRSWLEATSMMEIMRLLLPGVRLGTMLGRDTVKTRMKQEGMSVAEFLYPVMQAWDFWHLYSTRGVQIQIGGSDQFGNILAGIDAINFIRKNREPGSGHDLGNRNVQQAWQKKAIGFTIPLLTTKSGEKFGKSAGNAIWLDSERTSPFGLYQFFLGTADDDVHRYLKLFTFENLDRLEQLMKDHDSLPSKRLAQHALAMNVLRLVHGSEVAEKARDDHSRLFASRSRYFSTPPQPSVQKGQIEQISEELSVEKEIQASSKSPSTNITLPQSLVFNRPAAHVLFHAGLVSSRSEGRRLCAARGAYVGVRSGLDKGSELQWQPMDEIIDDLSGGNVGDLVIDGSLLLLRAGKTKVKIVTITSDQDFEARGLTAPGWQVSQNHVEHPT